MARVKHAWRFYPEENPKFFAEVFIIKIFGPTERKIVQDLLIRIFEYKSSALAHKICDEINKLAEDQRGQAARMRAATKWTEQLNSSQNNSSTPSLSKKVG